LPRPDTVNSSNLLRTYYRLFRQLWENTRENGLRPVQKSIRLFDEQIELIFTDERLLSFIMPALEHLSIAAQGNPSLKIYIGDDTTTNAVMPPPPWMEFGVQGVAGAIEGVFTHRGDVRGFTHDRIKTAFNWSANALSIYDPDEAVAFYWTRDTRDLPAYEISAPLRTILNWWVQRRNGHFMHGAVVGTTTGGVLLAGKGGSGKSTAALAALKEGLYYVSDDYCLIALQPEPAAYCVFSSAKVDPENLFRIPQIVSRRGNSGNPYDDKEVFFFIRSLPNKSFPVCLCARYFFPVLPAEGNPDYCPLQSRIVSKRSRSAPSVSFPGRASRPWNSSCRLSNNCRLIILNSVLICLWLLKSLRICWGMFDNENYHHQSLCPLSAQFRRAHPSMGNDKIPGGKT